MSEASKAFPDWLVSALASDASGGRGALASTIRALAPGLRAVGPALTVRAAVDDNSALRAALATSPVPGSVLVVSGHAASVTASCGDILALELKLAGIAALVTDGLVRDSREMLRLGFPVWCRGTTPVGKVRGDPGEVGAPIRVGEVEVRTGDLVIADDDGVMIWPQADIAELMKKAEAKDLSDKERVRGLLKGR